VSPAPDPFGPGYRDFLAARTRFLEGCRVESEIRRLERAWGADGHRRAHGEEQEMHMYLVTRRRGFASPGELEQAAARSGAAGERPGSGVNWIRTYALAEDGGGLGAVCLFEAESADAIRLHAQAARLPVDEIVPVADTVVVRPDPVGEST